MSGGGDGGGVLEGEGPSLLKDLLKDLQELTSACLTEETRVNLDKEHFLKVSKILTDYNSRPEHGDEDALAVISQGFRFLRNAVANCRRNQDFVRIHTDIFKASGEFISGYAQKPETQSEQALIAVRCSLQFLANCMVDNVENCQQVCESCLDAVCCLLKESKDEKIVQYGAMGIHTLWKSLPDMVCICDSRMVSLFLENVHLEFVVYVIESLCTSELFVLDMYSNLSTDVRAQFVKIILDHKNLHEKISNPVKTFFSKEFQQKCDLILKSNLESDEWLCWEIAYLLEFLCNVSAFDCGIKSDTSLLTTVVSLLKSVHSLGKSDGASSFSPLHGIDSFKTTKEEIGSQPTFQFKGNLIRLITNLIHRNLQHQELVREMEGLAVILDTCKIDDKNPFITEWAVLAIRNACEGNVANQEFIRSVQQIDTTSALSHLQFVGL